MVRLKTNKENILHRLKIARGQISKLIEMVQQDRYCIDILHTSLSTQKALKKVDEILMEDHLKHCAIDQAKKGETEKLVKELIEIYRYK